MAEMGRYAGEVFPNEVCQLPRFIEESTGTANVAGEGFVDDNARSVSHQTLSWALRKIGITDDYPYTGAGIAVSVLDTGIDPGHPDFAGRLRSENLETFIHSESVVDRHGHGTHCAGIIAGPRSSVGKMRYGVAPNVTLLIGKVLNNMGRGTDDRILAGINWAVGAGARVISMSFEKTRTKDKEPSPVYTALAKRLAARGIVMVAAAGNRFGENDVDPVSDPAACKGVLSVAAVDEFSRIADFCRGASDACGKVDIAAPGVRIYSAWKDGQFKLLNGTSMAAPHVAAAAALYLELDPGLSTEQLALRILDAVTPDIPVGRMFGRGVLQVPRLSTPEAVRDYLG
jgi:subtilisin family serine protease